MVKDICENNSKVSIIIPMYNGTKTLPETLESIFAQTYSNWEVIIVDDCSKDNSLSLAEEYAQKDSRIRVFQMSANGGPGAATKYGFEKATGGLVAFIDTDDLWVPDKLERQIKFMVENDYAFTATDYVQMDENSIDTGRIIKCKQTATYKDVLKTCPIGSSTVIITSELLSKVDIPTIRKNNDYSLWLRLLKIYPCVYGINEVMMRYRVWSESISYNKFKKVKYFWQVYREYEGFSVVKSLFLLMEWTVIKILKIK